MERYEEALRDFNQAIQLDPKLFTAYMGRSSVYIMLGRYEEAHHDFHYAIRMSPHFADMQNRMRRVVSYLEAEAESGDPRVKQQAAEMRRDWGEGAQPPPPLDLSQRAFEAFQQAGSIETMRQTVDSFPFMVQTDFIAAIEQAIAQQVPLEHRPAFEQRLAWLQQIAVKSTSPSQRSSPDLPSAFPSPVEEAEEADLAEADRLFIEAQKLKDKSSRTYLERAIEYADQAYTLYRRHGAPQTGEARQLVDEIYARLKRTK